MTHVLRSDHDEASVHEVGGLRSIVKLIGNFVGAVEHHQEGMRALARRLLHIEGTLLSTYKVALVPALAETTLIGSWTVFEGIEGGSRVATCTESETECKT